MGIGVDIGVYNWIAANAESYLGPDYYIGEEDGYYWFYELPDSLIVDEETGAVYALSNRPSQEPGYIGNLTT